jgi:Flavin reductase like domain
MSAAIQPVEPGLDERTLRTAFGRFAIHVVDAGHAGFVRRAAAPGADRLAEPSVLRDALATLECELAAEHPAGDHTIVVGRVLRLRVVEDGRPLVHFAGGFGRFEPLGYHVGAGLCGLALAVGGFAALGPTLAALFASAALIHCPAPFSPPVAYASRR